jgi:hypothetical protein
MDKDGTTLAGTMLKWLKMFFVYINKWN